MDHRASCLKRTDRRERATLFPESPVFAVKAYGVTPRGSLRGRGGDAEMGTHFVASPPSTKANHKRSLAPSTMVSSPAHELIPAHEFFCGRKRRLAPRPSSRVFFGSRKLRLAPQDYSPWTPPTDRLSGRSYPPASRHPPVLDLVGPSNGVQRHPERRGPPRAIEGSA